MSNSNHIKFLLLLLLFALLSFLSLKMGSINISLPELAHVLLNSEMESASSMVIYDIRMPRLLASLFAGMAISVAGLLMQTAFQNPLAGPYVLGISSGAGLGVAVVVLGAEFLGWGYISLHNSLFSIIFGSLSGSAFVLILVFLVASRIKSITTLLILGILFSGATSSLVNILQFFADSSNVKIYAIWTMGNLGGLNLPQAMLMSLLILVAIGVSIGGLRFFDAYMLGEMQARTLGVPVKPTRFLLLGLAGYLTAIVTAFLGPVAFLGIAVPHIARTLFNSFSHRVILPASALIGANILIFSDIVSRLPGSAYTIPLNSVTSLIGIPVVVWLLLSKKRINFGD